MQKRFQERVTAILTSIGIVLLAATFASGTDNDSGDSEDSVIARVLELRGQVSNKGTDQDAVGVGTILTVADTLELTDGAHLTLILHDGTITEFDGPGEITLGSVSSRQDTNILAKLGAALSNIFFSSGEDEGEVTLGVRDPATLQALPLRVPRMLYPPSGVALMFPPARLRWQPIEGVIFYRVSVYGRNELVWEGRTNASYIDLPPSDSVVNSGNDYLWVVEAELGDSGLRSQQASFSILSDSIVSRIEGYLRQIDAEVEDERLRHYLRAALYRDHDLKLECYEEADAILRISPEDYSALIMQARLLEEMAFLEEAIKVYKSLVNQ